MLKRAELVLKYLMKSIDAMKQMQDSELPSLEETLRHEVKTTPSFMFFPDDVVDLPCDPTKSEQGITTLLLPNSTRIGRLPKRKIRHSKYCEETEQDLVEMTQFVDTTQPWRTRCVTMPQEKLLLDIEPLPNELSNDSETFDLTSIYFLLLTCSKIKNLIVIADLLEELSSLEETLVATELNQVSVNSNEVTPCVTYPLIMPSSSCISTPQRLKDLRIVSDRLASLRKQNFNS